MKNKRSTSAGVSLTARAALMAAAVAGGTFCGIHEAEAVDQIQRYCTTSWQNAQIAPTDWSDCTQETIAELLRRVSRSRMTTAIAEAASEERRELNRSIWCTVQRWRRARRLRQLNEIEILDPRSEQTKQDSLDAADGPLAAALHKLSVRQQEILMLWSEGWSVAEISEKLDIPTPRVSDEKYKALAKLRRTLTEDDC